MSTAICDQENDYPLRRSLILLILIILPMVLCPVGSVKAQDQPQQEKNTMASAASPSKPPLDLRAPALIETASFALG